MTETREYNSQLLQTQQLLLACTETQMHTMCACLLLVLACLQYDALQISACWLGAYLLLELVSSNSDCSCGDSRAGCLATKGSAHAATAGSAPALCQAQHHSCGLHHEVGALRAGPDLQGRYKSGRPLCTCPENLCSGREHSTPHFKANVLHVAPRTLVHWQKWATSAVMQHLRIAEMRQFAQSSRPLEGVS